MAAQIRHQDTLPCGSMDSWLPSLPCVNVTLLCAGFKLPIKHAQGLSIHPGHIFFLPFLLLNDLHIPGLLQGCFLLLVCAQCVGFHVTAQASAAMRQACKNQQPAAWPYTAFDIWPYGCPFNVLLGADPGTLSWQGNLGAKPLPFDVCHRITNASSRYESPILCASRSSVQQQRAWGAFAPWLQCLWCQAVSCL